jgi:glycerol-3-phosphate O-acyltransferase
MTKEFKHGFILGGFFNNYLSKINKTDNYLDIIKENQDDNKIIIFIAKDVDFIEYLYVNYYLNELKLGQISYVNELKTFLWETPTSLFNKTLDSIDRDSKNKLFETFDNNYKSMIFLRKSKFLGLLDRDFKESPLLDIVKYQKTTKKEIILLPELLILEKSPENIEKLMKGNKSSNFLKISYQLMKNYKNSYASILEPINLLKFIEENPHKSDIDLAESLEAKILFKLEKECQVITGPTIRNTNVNIEQIIKTNNVQNAIKKYSETHKKSFLDSEKKAKDILSKIAADYHVSMIQKFVATLSVVFSKLYSEIDIPSEDINNLKKLLKTHTVILAPSHKSHVDYLVLSHIFYLKGLVPPHIAAGDNLSFFPMGYIFRRSGAFFLKRSFRHDEFYYTIFKQYLSKLLKDRFSIEFFIEGTRSRTGKLLPPKTGMLSMFFDSFWENVNKKIAILPVAINYEKIIEEKSYVNELSGGEKKKENLNTIFSNRKLLKSRFGKVYIRFSEPIKLDEYFEKNDIASKKPNDKTISYHLNKVSYQILNSINQTSIVTASSILGIVLLSEHSKEKFDFSDILGRFLLVYKDLSKKGAPISKTLTTPVLALEEALDFFISNKHITLIDDKFETYELLNSKRANIEYYKNNILHYFINESLLVLAVKKSSNKLDIKKNTKFLSLIFQDEFIFNPNDKYEINFIQTLTDMVSRNILKKENDVIEINRGTKGLCAEFYYSILMPFVESYSFCISELIKLNKRENYRTILSNIVSVSRRQSSDFHYEESINKNKFENCIKMLIDLNVLTADYEGKVKYVTVSKIDELLEMSNNLRDFLIFD